MSSINQIDYKGTVYDICKPELDSKADKDGSIASAEQLLSSIFTTNDSPYIYRPTPADSDRERVKRLEGLSVGWNQLCNASSVTVTSGHKYYMKKAGVESIGASDGTALTGLTSGTDMVIDLTILFGSSVADHIYTLEQATEGSGVAWVKQYIDLDSYHEYSAPTIKSVEGLEAHVMRDADDNIIGNYPLDSTITLRGVPKLVDGQLVADGDYYPPSGDVTVRYGIVDLGDLNWQKSSSGNKFYVQASSVQYAVGADVKMICAKYIFDGAVYTDPYYGDDKTIRCYQRGNAQASCELYVHDEAYSDAESFKTAMSGIMLVYELATPTTSTASPYQEVQICESGGTEEFVTDGVVPVGNVTEYTADLRKQVENIYGIPKPPTSNGSYKLALTVSGGTPTYSWVSDS